MKAFNPKEARPPKGPNSSTSSFTPTQRPFSGVARGNRDDTFRKPFSKPAGAATAGGYGSFNNKQEFRPRGPPAGRDASGGQRPPQQRMPATSPSASKTAAGALSTASEMFAEDETATETATKPVKVKKPKVPKPPLDPNEHITQRAFIGGLAKELAPADLEGRFKSFGQLKDVYLAKDVDGTCRGFGYVTLDTTRKEWLKCVTLFNGAKWKGNVMKIEEADKDWQTR